MDTYCVCVRHLLEGLEGVESCGYQPLLEDRHNNIENEDLGGREESCLQNNQLEIKTLKHLLLQVLCEGGRFF